MKKLFAILMAIAMIAALSVTAFAAIQEEDGTASITVNGVYTPEAKPATYYVTLSATSLEFTYVGAGYEWNQEELDWDAVEGQEAHWAATTKTFSIENRSSVGVEATVTANATSTATLKVKTAAMDAAAATATVSLDAPADGTADSETITVEVGGSITDDGAIGSITVALS